MLLILFICACVYGYIERKRRRAIAEANGGFPVRSGSYITSLFECIGLPRFCFPATFFPFVLAAFNRAEVDRRDCHACDALWSLKIPITQYQTRQSMRGQFKLADAPIADCLAAVCCTPCAVAQDAIELERRAVLTQAMAVPDSAEVAISVPMEAPPSYKGDYEKVPAQCQV